MMALVDCAIFYALTGFMCFLFGRFVPKKFFNPNAVIFRSLPFERDGEIYERIGIKYWQNRLPDMSKLLPGTMPAKSVEKIPTSANVMIMLRETCVAEMVHWVLYLWGLGSFRFFRVHTAVIVYIIYVAANTPFILIQRYNRPRLKKLYAICIRRERAALPAQHVPASVAAPQQKMTVGSAAVAKEKKQETSVEAESEYLYGHLG